MFSGFNELCIGMSSIVQFEEAYERAGLSFRSGKFKLHEKSDWIKFGFKKTGWIYKRSEIITDQGMKINSEGFIIDKKNEKIGDIQISRNILSFYTMLFKVKEDSTRLVGIHVKKDKSDGNIRIEIHSETGIFTLKGRHADPFLFPLNLGQKVFRQSDAVIESDDKLCILVMYLCLMGTNNC